MKQEVRLLENFVKIKQAGWALAKKLFNFRRRRKEFFLAVAGGCVDFLEIL